MVRWGVRFLRIMVAAVLASGAVCHGQVFEGTELVKAELVADSDGVVPGGTFTVGLHLRTAPGWHTYWRYAGDAGLPTRIEWTLPAGFTAGPIEWPLPGRQEEPGGIETYAYPGDVLLPVEIHAPADLKAGAQVELKAHASWLVCKEICVPGKADLAVSLPVETASHAANGDLFQKARAGLPAQGVKPFTASWGREGEALVLTVMGLDPGATVDFFPIPGDVQVGHVTVNEAKVTVPLLDPKETAKEIDGVVVIKKGDARECWQLSGNAGAAGSAGAPMAGMAANSLLYWLGLGFLGGMILNVMPCVLPVIALKVFGFIKQAGESPRRILALGFTFVAGIFAWFMFLAGLIVGFKAAGHQLNWAFQFQHPAFVAVMVLILLAFSLNLLGVFEIVLPGSVASKVSEAAQREGYAGTFWHGVFATLMATPCTAPFLGPALGFALAQPAGTVFAMFGSIAAGMSAPYAVLAVKPGWLRYLPKPGIWMVRVKQALGVLLLGTVCWLGTVLYHQFADRPTPFQPRLTAALAQNKIVFVDFTADWCVNCKVNERVVLDSDVVKDAFAKRGVTLLKADWTSGDADITALLRKFGRAGVPCYVVYPVGGEPIVLPEVITQDIVLKALDQAAR